jgi:hypothetical protein
MTVDVLATGAPTSTRVTTPLIGDALYYKPNSIF